ncbi:hypothetical protein C8R46DRAFT_1342508 [Mycena filopes]|nr:hypothetical protein C8R46DRAFT_1342508 [Mycena filopes]
MAGLNSSRSGIFTSFPLFPRLRERHQTQEGSRRRGHGPMPHPICYNIPANRDLLRRCGVVSQRELCVPSLLGLQRNALIVNTYLISRFYSVSKNIFVTLALLVINLFAAIMTLILILTDTTLQLKNLIPMITTWAISAAVTDVLIALSLVWTLRGMKTSFKDTDRLLRRIMILSVQNGCTTALASIGAMIASLVMPFRSISVIFTYMLGPLYFLTLVSNLNLRGSSKSSSRGWSSGRNNTVGGTTSIVINGIRVERTAVTTVDPSNSELELEGRKDREDDGSVHHKQQDLGVGVGGFRQNIHFNGDA